MSADISTVIGSGAAGYVAVCERETWGHVGVFDVVRSRDAVTLSTFAQRPEAERFAAQINAIAVLAALLSPADETGGAV